MTGTVLAVVLALFVALREGSTLIAAWRSQRETRPSRTQQDPSDDYVTRSELSEALQAFSRDHEFEMNEWYEKFATLHARLSKRVKREQQVPPPQLGLAQGGGSEDRPSIIHHRKLGSV